MLATLRSRVAPQLARSFSQATQKMAGASRISHGGMNMARFAGAAAATVIGGATAIVLAQADEQADEEDPGFPSLDDFDEFSQDESDVEPGLHGIINLTGHSLESTALNPDKDVIILKWTIGCPACLAFRTLLEQVAQAMDDVDNKLVIAFYRSDLNFAKTACYTTEEALSDPVVKLFCAGGEATNGLTMGMDVSQSESIARWLHEHSKHKFDLDAVLERLKKLHPATDELLIERFKQFSLGMCKDDAAKGRVRSGSEATYFRSLCDPCNPCSETELTWFAHMMTFPARSSSTKVKGKENMKCLRKCMKCKNSPEFEEYLKGLAEYAEEQMALREDRLQQAESKKKSSAKATEPEKTPS